MNGVGILATLTIALMISQSAATTIWAQADSFSKNFKKFPAVIPGVDFFAAQRSDVTALEKPLREAQQKFSTFLGDKLPNGAIVICSALEQKDSVNEARVLKMGYQWVLIQLTPAAAQLQVMAQMKSQLDQMKARMGGQLPPGMLERIQSPSPEMKAAGEARMMAAILQQYGQALLWTALAPNKPFRASRLDDLGRSPLADWLDLGLVSYAAGTLNNNLPFLQSRLEEAFSLEDLLEMARPFVAPSSAGGAPSGGGGAPAGGGVMIFRSPGGAGSGGDGSHPPSPNAGARGGRGGGGFSMPKDVQDRMTFDGQAALFFSYCLQKLGLPSIKELVQWNREGKNVREFLFRKEALGPNPDEVEKEWHSWLKAQKAETPPSSIIFRGPAPNPQ